MKGIIEHPQIKARVPLLGQHAQEWWEMLRSPKYMKGPTKFKRWLLEELYLDNKGYSSWGCLNKNSKGEKNDWWKSIIKSKDVS